MPVTNAAPPVKLHASKHQDTGADEISIAALSGELADRQKSKAGTSVLGWTDEKLLKGAGAGVAPDEIDVPSAIPQLVIATIFETSARLSPSVAGGGSTDMQDFGMRVLTSATAGGRVSLYLSLTSAGAFTVFQSNSQFSCVGRISTKGTDFHIGWVIGSIDVDAAGIVFTSNHYGFKWTRVANGVVVGSATNADGTTETATDIGDTFPNVASYHAIKTGVTNIKYYRERVLLATHTTNLPTTATTVLMMFGIANVNTATASIFELSSFTYQQDAE